MIQKKCLLPLVNFSVTVRNMYLTLLFFFNFCICLEFVSGIVLVSFLWWKSKGGRKYTFVGGLPGFNMLSPLWALVQISFAVHLWSQFWVSSLNLKTVLLKTGVLFKQVSDLIISTGVLGSSETAVAEWSQVGRAVEKAFGFMLLASPDMLFT